MMRNASAAVAESGATGSASVGGVSHGKRSATVAGLYAMTSVDAEKGRGD